MSENKEENVVLEAKLNNGAKKEENVLKISINEQQAATNIAKSLIDDFLNLITIIGLKAVFAKFPDKKQFMSDILDIWRKRTSVQLAEETKTFQNSVMQAFSNEANVSEETTLKMNKQITSFNNTRDAAVKIAEEGINSIINTIVNDDEKPQETK